MRGHQIEILELRSIVAKMKFTRGKVKSRLEQAD